MGATRRDDIASWDFEIGFLPKHEGKRIHSHAKISCQYLSVFVSLHIAATRIALRLFQIIPMESKDIDYFAQWLAYAGPTNNRRSFWRQNRAMQNA